MTGFRSTLIAGTLGAAAAVATDVATSRVAPSRRTEAAGLGLLGAAAIYPLARRRAFGDAREKATFAAVAALLAAAAAQPGMRRHLVAGGWLAHAGFDALFTPHRDSRIPGWYPAMCAGYDVALAARLVTG